MREIRYAIRSLLNTPAVTCLVVIVLALGLGAATAMFTVTNGVLLRPLPFAQPERLVQIDSVGVLEFQAFREHGRAFVALASYSTADKDLLGSGDPERISVVTAEPGVFDLLGGPALAGRTFRNADPAGVAVLGERFWRRRFDARPPTGEWTISLDSKPYAVVGVLPEGFQFPYRPGVTDAWIASGLPRTDNRFQRIDAAIGRLSPGDAQAETTARGRYFSAIEDRVRQVPGVTAAGFVTRLHVQSPGNTGRFAVAGRPVPSDGHAPIVRLREASPGYFRALGVPLRAGRPLGEGERGVLVNEAFVRAHFPGENPIGRVLNRGTIVGVVADIRQKLRAPAEPEIYGSIAGTSYSAATLVVKGHVPPKTLLGPVRAAVKEVNPRQTVFDARTMQDVVATAYSDVDLALWLAGFSAVLAIVLSMAGVYGVISAGVTARRREFGIRLALGADPARLLRMVAAQAAVVLGAAGGVAGALVLTRFLRSLLCEVTPTDPATFAVAALALTSTGIVACVAPARRAMTLDPLTVLRHE